MDILRHGDIKARRHINVQRTFIPGSEVIYRRITYDNISCSKDILLTTGITQNFCPSRMTIAFHYHKYNQTISVCGRNQCPILERAIITLWQGTYIIQWIHPVYVTNLQCRTVYIDYSHYITVMS